MEMQAGGEEVWNRNVKENLLLEQNFDFWTADSKWEGTLKLFFISGIPVLTVNSIVSTLTGHDVTIGG